MEVTGEGKTTMSNKWTTNDMPDLTGKVVIVTGANSGIGYESVKAFAIKGAEVILACRSMDKAEAALAELKRKIPNAQAVVMKLDLASQKSVRRFAAAFKANYERLDVLLNNAGIMWVPYSTTEDGFESQFGTNHLGHFALTGLLLDLILATPDARVVNVSSIGHRHGVMDWDNLIFKGGEGYSAHRAYSRSKLANLLFTYELQRRFEAAGSGAIAVAAHPGGSDTNLAGHLLGSWYMRFLYRIAVSLFAQSAAMGALPSIRASVDPQVKGGQYYGPEGFMEQRGYPLIVQSSRASHNEADARKLWGVSEQLTGVTFSFDRAGAAEAVV